MSQIVFVNQSNKRIPRRHLERCNALMKTFFNKYKAKINLKDKEIVVVFLGEKEAQKLNKQYRNKNYPTDILSFSGLDSSHLGDLIFCPQVIERQAKEHQLSFRDETAYLFIHGVLHLLGFNHEGVSPQKAKKMFKVQDQIFELFLNRR